MMELRETFTDAEWKNLISLPYAVSMMVSLAVPDIMSMRSEMKVILTQPINLAAESGSTLVGLVSAELQSKGKRLIIEQQDLIMRNKTGYRAKTIEGCKSATAALSKIAPEESLAYREWIVAIGRKVAEAAEEGDVAVSEPEKAALNDISTALGFGG
jgi:hypothetical protein